MKILLLILLTTNIAFALDGTISTLEKNAVKKVKVTIKYDNEEISVLSGDRGDFKFSNIPANKSFEIIASKNNYGSVSFFGNTSQSQAVNLELNPERFELKGRVLTPSGEGIPDFLINGSILTDDNGNFTWQIPYENKYAVNASKYGYVILNKVEGIMLGDVERVLIADFD